MKRRLVIYVIYIMNQTELMGEIFTGGKKIQKIARCQNKADEDHRRDLFNRFSNYQIPVGLPLNKMYLHHFEDVVATDPIENEIREQNLTYQMVDNRRFDALFYSVGKDLGNSGLNKTKKRKNEKK